MRRLRRGAQRAELRTWCGACYWGATLQNRTPHARFFAKALISESIKEGSILGPYLGHYNSQILHNINFTIRDHPYITSAKGTSINPIPTGHCHVTLIYGLIPPMAGRNRVKPLLVIVSWFIWHTSLHGCSVLFCHFSVSR